MHAGCKLHIVYKNNTITCVRRIKFYKRRRCCQGLTSNNISKYMELMSRDLFFLPVLKGKMPCWGFLCFNRMVLITIIMQER